MANKLGGIMIDCSEDVFEEGVRFWSAALGVEPKRRSDAANPYVGLPGAYRGLEIEVQQVGGPSRYHLDLAAEDVEEEVARLESLGATKIERVETWWVMQAPTGHLFCVVPK